MNKLDYGFGVNLLKIKSQKPLKNVTIFASRNEVKKFYDKYVQLTIGLTLVSYFYVHSALRMFHRRNCEEFILRLKDFLMNLKKEHKQNI